MCQFITAFLPGTTDLTAATAMFDKHALGFQEIANPHVRAQVLPSEVFVLTTRGRCDCGTPLGSQARDHTITQSEWDRQIEKLRKQGWSPAKIQRWQEQKLFGEEKREREQQSHAANATPQLTQWIAFIADILQSRLAATLGMLLHEGHDLEHEHFEIIRQEAVRLPELTTTQLLQIQTDVLYRYRL